MKASTYLRTNLRLPGYICRSCTRQIRRAQRGYATEASNKPEIYDVVCVGGGPAGLGLLAALRASPITSGLKIALVEGQDLGETRSLPAQFSNRCSSLTPAAADYFEKIGAWKHFQHERVQPYEEMQVWDGVSGARIEFDWPESSGRKTIAYMVENANITAALLKRIDELSGVSIFDNSRVENISFGKETEVADLSAWPVVELKGGIQLAARLLVGADGARSPVRTFANIQSNGWDYDRQGVVATFRLAPSSNASPPTAYQRFLPTGPIALLPLPNNHASLVWTTTPTRATLLKTLSRSSPADFIGLVNAAFRLEVTDLSYMHSISQGQADEYQWRLKDTFPPLQNNSAHGIPQEITSLLPNSTASFPLRLSHADTYIAPRLALLGDAAHTIHPLAGQGLNQGQFDVQSLVGTIEYAVQHGMDIGALLSLERYNMERYAKNHVLLGVCDKLHKVYGVENGMVVGLRSWGLRGLDGLGGLKGWVMGMAAGGLR